jgi:trk system potassium uptake protein
MRMQGSKPGDVRIRVTRTRPDEYKFKPPRKLRRPTPPALVLIYAFLVLIALGTVLLILPISSQAREWTDPLSALFIATSAVCVTGLVVLDTGTHWSGFGQVVILLLIQLGGFGIMAGSTLLLQFVLRRASRLSDRVRVQESTGVPQLGDVTRVVRRVALFTLAVEGAGAIVLALAFFGRGAVDDPVAAGWWGIFHSVSAFNNAGFDLIGGFRSLSPFFDDVIILGTIGTLLVIGGLGFAIMADTAAERRWQRLALETKIVLATSAVLLFGGAIVIGALEWNNPETLALYPEAQRPLNALFESATLRTAGFSVLDTGSLLDSSLFVVMGLMFIGGASGSTAGGIKINTFSLLLLTIISTAKGEPSVTAFGRRIKHELIYRALAVALLSLAFLFVIGLLLTLTTDFGFVRVLFEAVSAVGTVGASTGITPDLDGAARLVVIVAMFAGRLGPLTLVLALAARQRAVVYRPAVESIRIG